MDTINRHVFFEQFRHQFSVVESALEVRSHEVINHAALAIPVPYPIKPYKEHDFHDSGHGFILEAAMMFTEQNPFTYQEAIIYKDQYESIDKTKVNGGLQRGIANVMFTERMERIAKVIIASLENLDVAIPYMKRLDTPSYKIAAAVSIMHAAKRLG